MLKKGEPGANIQGFLVRTMYEKSFQSCVHSESDKLPSQNFRDFIMAS